MEIPATWSGLCVTLFLQRGRWVTTVWLGAKLIGMQDSLSGPHICDFGTRLTPGKHRLTICVDNTVKLDPGKFVSAPQRDFAAQPEARSVGAHLVGVALRRTTNS